MKYKTHIKLVHEFYDTCFQIIWKNKNQPSKSTCSDIALRLLVNEAGILYWELQVTSSISIWVAFQRVVLREVYFEGPNRKTSILNTDRDISFGGRGHFTTCPKDRNDSPPPLASRRWGAS